MSTTFEKTWQFAFNQAMSATNTNKNGIWWVKAFLKGDIGSALNAGLWTCYYSCDSTTAGAAGDGIDYWGTQGGTTANSGSAASITTGATIVGGVVLTGLTGLSAASVGNFLTISGAASAGNNSKTNTPWRIIRYISATSVEIYNPAAVTGDANNGSIVWAERTLYTFDSAKIVQNTGGNAHSWFVLKSPATLGPFYLILDCKSASVDQMSIMACKTAPTGGSTTARPTSTDEFGFSTVQSFLANGSVTQWMWHGALSTTGDFTLLGGRTPGAGAFETALIGQSLADTKSADNYKFVFYCAPAQGNGQNALTAARFSTSGFWYGQKFDGSEVLGNLAPIEMGMSNGSSVFDDLALVDYTDGRYDDAVVYLVNNVAAKYTLKGRLYDIRRAPSSMPEGFCEPNPSTPASFTAGDYWFPGNAQPQL